MEIQVTGCFDCVFCSSSYDSILGVNAWTHLCMVAEKFNSKYFLEKDEKGTPITPDWCPLKQKIIVCKK